MIFDIMSAVLAVVVSGTVVMFSLQDIAFQRTSSECTLCGKKSRLKCVLCNLHWHPSCCDIVLRSLPHTAFQQKVKDFADIELVRSAIRPLGQDALTKFERHVVQVHRSHSRESTPSVDNLNDVQMPLEFNLTVAIAWIV